MLPTLAPSRHPGHFWPRLERLWPRQRQAAPLPFLLPVIFLLVLCSLPILYVVLRANEEGWANAAQLLFRPRVFELLVDTVVIDAVVTVLSVVIGVGAAWFIERSDLPGRKMWNVLLTLPFAVPAFVSGYSWISLFPGVEGFGGATLVLTLTYYPLVYLPVAAALRSMNPALEEVALSLGYDRRQAFFRVVLPYLWPAILAGALLVALHMLAEFGPLAFMNYDTFTTAIYDQYMVAYNSAAAAMLTSVLLLLCLSILVLELFLRGNARYASTHVTGRVSRIALGRSRWLVMAAFGILILLGVGIPVGALVYWMLTGSSAASSAADVFSALYATLSFSVGGSALAVVFAVPLVILAIRRQGLFPSLADRLPYFIHCLPGLVVGLTFVFFAVRYVNPLYQTVPLLLLAYAMLYLPLAQSSIRAVMVQVPRQVEEVAASLGTRPLAVFARITFPIISSGIGAGFALVFLKVMSELTATLILRPIGIETLATKIWEHTMDVEYAAAAPYAMLLILLSGLPVYLLTLRSTRARKERPT